MTTRKRADKKEKHPWDYQFKLNEGFTLNDTHNSFVELAKHHDTKMVFVDGPAGTAKTYLATFAGLTLLQRKNVERLVYIRSVVESASQKMGSLPGEVEDKFLPWSMPLIEKLDELAGIPGRMNLLNSQLIECVPVNFVRGLTFNDSVVIVDEAQNLTRSELVTILTRFGANSKFVVIGDSNQSDINGKSGFGPIYNCFDNKSSEREGIFTFKFTGEDIVRSEILKFIVKKLDTL